MFNNIKFILITLFFFTDSFSQDAFITLKGKVSDLRNNAIADVIVEINSIGKSTASNSKGFFNFILKI